MITGDKVETAIGIAKSTKFINKKTQIVIINNQNADIIKNQIIQLENDF